MRRIKIVFLGCLGAMILSAVAIYAGAWFLFGSRIGIEAFHDTVDQGMSLDVAVRALEGTAYDHPESWWFIMFSCTRCFEDERDDGCSILTAWDLDSGEVDVEKTISELRRCEVIEVRQRRFGYSGSFSMTLGEDRRVKTTSAPDAYMP